MLGLGGFEFDVLGTGFIITGLDNFDLERWTATSTASAPEGSSKDSTPLISIQGEYLGIRIETFNCLMEEKEVTSLQMVDQATQNRNLRTPYRSGACHNETQSTVNQSLWYQHTK